jgi:hypothetical protein
MNGTSVLAFRGQWSDHNRFAQHGYKHPEPLSTFISISRLEKNWSGVFLEARILPFGRRFSSCEATEWKQVSDFSSCI